MVIFWFTKKTLYFALRINLLPIIKLFGIKLNEKCLLFVFYGYS